jgi:hypothetical protein
MSNLADQIINVDYGKLGSSLSTIFTGAVNSVTDFLKGIDYIKVGNDIADFLNGIDWQGVANSLFDLIATGIKAIPDIAMSFFANADIGNIMTMIGLLGAPKLLGGITDFTSSGEGQSLGQAAGSSWSGAFMAGIRAFGLGYAIGTYLRDNIKIGDKTLGEWVDQAAEEALSGKDEEGNYNTSIFGNIARIKDYNKAMEDKYDVYTDPYGNQYYKTSIGGEDSDAVYRKMERDKSINLETFKYYANGGIQSAYKYDAKGNLSEAWKKYGGIAFGDGGRVTKPTFALIGEKEPETIVPDSKRGEFGNTYNTEVHIHIDGTGKNADEIADEAIEIVSTKLSFLGITQQRAVGGKSWA